MRIIRLLPEYKYPSLQKLVDVLLANSLCANYSALRHKNRHRMKKKHLDDFVRCCFKY